MLNTLLTDEEYSELKCERKRLETFRGWINRYPVRENLAHYGFIYLNSADRVQCVFCKVVLYNWKREHNPLQRHAETSPDCPFLRGFNVGNIPLQREYNTVRLYRYDGKKWKASSDMNDTSKRLDSFQNWPHKVYLDKNEFVHSGLYFTGISDCVKCFSCNVEMYDWDLNDDPMLHHESFSPECEYLKTIQFPRPLDNENDFYKTKIYRQDSFKNWNCSWKHPQDPSALATQGFFYNKNKDVVQCVFCGVIITEWNDKKSVIEKHVELSYKCPFLLGRPVGNKDRDLAQQIQSTNSDSNADMRDEEKRRETFKTWPYFGIDTRELAHVGFYYIGKRDLVQCFKCDGMLGDWSRYDDPWLEHRRHFPKCEYITMLNAFRREGTCAYFYKILNPYKPKEEENKSQKEHDDETCKICTSGDLNTLFEPCCHLVSCEDCSLKLFKCPVYERKRLETFKGWPNWSHPSKQLTECGFIYLNSADRVQCVFCKIVLQNWEPLHKPLQRHAESSPDCPFLRGLNVGNIPLHEKYEPVKFYSWYDCKSRKASSDMNDASKRLDSFQNWPHRLYLDKNEFVHSGLYFTGISDCVKCFSCNVEMYDWDLNDDPMLHHKWFSPECEYLKTIKIPCPLDNEKDDTVTITEWNDEKPIIEKHVELSYKCPFLLGTPVGNEPKDPAQRIQFTLNFSNMELRNEEKRRETFKTWPYFGMDTRELAHLGFYYIGKGDFVQCFKCGGVLGDWSRYDDPWVEHQRYFPECEFVKMMNRFIIERASPYFYYSLKPKTEENQLKKQYVGETCKICHRDEMNILFKPCYHLVSCKDCSLKLFKCPVCRKDIISKKKNLSSFHGRTSFENDRFIMLNYYTILLKK
ncbi:baculoviral IAP repeat-containing protein 1f [Caerostris extrusa]|uniref:Baculoviral IAP repeat-containing protein 1f n=1 Tax=Caerostris extrusa TaxID=172846 RepID=A0AAV4RJF0_CAEEX|nr:baculoviral IAP repeat-containing protein 1f [Caerostris extrusa]